ncbi:MAG: hypothetical protein P4N59_17700 [Negativicutes bacterium]|nr:hypothetical protein [Negativicutes bacterium]
MIKRTFGVLLLTLLVLLGGFAAGGQAGGHEAFIYPDSWTADDGSPVSGEERQAITVMAAGFEAYNSGDSKQVKAIHWWLRPVQDKDVIAALVRGGLYRLHAVDVVESAGDRMKVVALYSREVADAQGGSMLGFSRGEYTLLYRDGVWGITGYKALEDKDVFALIVDWTKAAKRYGVNDLSHWGGLVR